MYDNLTIQTDYDVANELYTTIKKDTIGIQESLKDNTFDVLHGNKFLVRETFEDMNLSHNLLQALYEAGYKKPSQIQKVVIPHIQSLSNVAMQSKSGTGKTIAFAVGILSKIKPGNGTQAIILSPTRELNMQIHDELVKLTRNLHIQCHLALVDRRMDNLDHEIIMGSPGIILSLLSRKKIDTSNVTMLVLDETDVLLEKSTMGAQTFRLLKIFERCQKVYISATYNENIKNTINAYSPECALIYEGINAKPEEIKLYYVDVRKIGKVQALLSIYGLLTVAQIIVFVSRKSTIRKLEEILVQDMNSVSILHGDLELKDRDRAVDDFKTSKTKILITTDVFSRGMDIPQVNLIINYDLPYNNNELLIETYIHRIGRSGRFGRSGFVIDMIYGEKELADYIKIQESLDTISKKFTVEALMDVNCKE